MIAAERLNADGHAGNLDLAALQRAMRAQGDAWQSLVAERCPHLFAGVAVFITSAQLQQMQGVIEAVERVVWSGEWKVVNGKWENPLSTPDSLLTTYHLAKGVFYGYDFHLNEQGAHLIEINTNAGGGFLNALLLDSQRDMTLPGIDSVRGECLPFVSLDTPRNARHSGRTVNVSNHTEQIFLDMFRNEWRLERGDAPLKTIAIVDEKPEEQYLYPEFVLARNVFERAGITTHIVGPDMLQSREDGLYLCKKNENYQFPPPGWGRARERVGDQDDSPLPNPLPQGERESCETVGDCKIDLVYNRLTDFDLQRHPQLRAAYEKQQAVITPNPAHYHRYADKRKLALLTDGDGLRAAGVPQANIDALLKGIPQTRIVRAEDAERWWTERKQWFFKPVSGYGGKGAYRGEKLTRRVFDEIMHSGYVAQRLALPGVRNVCVEGAEPQSLKYDVRCYVYDGELQLVAARLYQGQTTNFRTPGGGFALVRVVE